MPVSDVQVEQDAVDLEGEGSPGFNTAEALRALLVKKGLITPEVCSMSNVRGITSRQRPDR
jgi:hypothetical protein